MLIKSDGDVLTGPLLNGDINRAPLTEEYGSSSGKSLHRHSILIFFQAIPMVSNLLDPNADIVRFDHEFSRHPLVGYFEIRRQDSSACCP